MSSSIDLSKLKVVKLSKIYDLSKFDCGDLDINDFIKNDALKYELDRLATTSLLILDDRIVGFFSLVNDCIKLADGEKEKQNIKRLREYPASKIARLGVVSDMQKQGLGKLIIQIVIGIVLDCPHCACRFVTVDAYPAKIGFYQICGFVPNQIQDKNQSPDDYVSMRFDLLNPPIHS